ELLGNLVECAAVVELQVVEGRECGQIGHVERDPRHDADDADLEDVNLRPDGLSLAAEVERRHDHPGSSEGDVLRRRMSEAKLHRSRALAEHRADAVGQHVVGDVERTKIDDLAFHPTVLDITRLSSAACHYPSEVTATRTALDSSAARKTCAAFAKATRG